MSDRISEKKKSLLAYKDELLRDIKYFEKRIEEARLQKKDSFYFDDDESDSEADFMLDIGPPICQLKADQDMLKTCLHATQELTNLYVLQSEVNVMVNDPVFEWEARVTEEGTWREVTAECRVDLVPVTIQFYAHQPSRLFGPTSYRGLRVQVLKAAHESELNRSILPKVTTPSDAVEILRSYSAAHRARRTILSRLAEKYPNCLFMEPLTDGGFMLKCANLLEVSWTLENKWSPIAPFHHKMKFNLEYMDEAYVKIIAQAYKELLDPALETDERLRLMSKIIATCLEAQGPTQELYESMESDIESENLRKRRTTLDEEIEEPIQKKQKDSEVMAPPKTLPKKSKPKGKENTAHNVNQVKATKRPVTDNTADGAKKAKLSDHENVIKSKDVNTKENNNAKENIVHTKNSNSKASSDVTKAKKSKNVDKTNNAEQNVVGSEIIHKEIPINKAGGSKNKVDTVNSNNVKDSNIKPSKVQEKVVKDSEEINNVKKGKTNKVQKNPEPSITDKNKGTSNNGKNIVDTNSVNNEEPSKNKVSNKENIASKDNKIKSSDNVGDRNILPKSKSTANVNDKAAKVTKISVEPGNTVNKKSKAKSMERPKSVNPKDLNSEQINTKTDLNLQKNMKVNAGTDSIKAKSNKQNPKKVKENINNNITKNAVVENSAEIINAMTKSQNIENVPKDIANNKKKINNVLKASTEKPSKINKNSKLTKTQNNDNEKIVQDNAPVKTVNLKHHDTLQKAVVRSSLISKVSDKISEKMSEKIDNITTKNLVNAKKTSKNIDNTNKKVTKPNVIDKNSIENSKNVDKNSDKEGNSKEKQISNKIDKVNDNKLTAAVKKPQSSADSIKTIKNKTPMKVNKINILNPRNRKSVGTLKINKNKESDTQKDGRQQSKINTKIPQKLGLKHVRGDVKSNPLRISPRKMQFVSKADSQNSSRASQISVQTGIPRLMKKPVSKLK